MANDRQPPGPIVIVGPCASGKTTLVRGLWAHGYPMARVVAQEHSGVSDLWKLRGQAEVLIYLDAQLDTIAARQRRTDWTPDYLAEQHRRLRGAWLACGLYLPTDDLQPAEVLERVITYLSRRPVAMTEERSL